ncbi:glycosyltransferase family 4 protein [Streptomyces sp. NPDC001634]|uniref:glycosyltransferase family 4 protein n=1 Tax=Streptomyces sp. NPDC001634 TaxID=3154390 RepID=UPI00333033B3
MHWAFPPTVGGVESHLADYAGLLARRGHTVTLLTGEARPRPVDRVEILTHPLLRLAEYQRRGTGQEDSARRWLTSAEQAQAAELHRWLAQVVDSRGVHLVHGHNLHHFSPVPALALGRLQQHTGIPLLHTYHSVWPEDPWTAQFCRSWDGHYVVSDYLAFACRTHLGIRARRTYLGIATERFRELPPAPADGAFTVLLPARLIPDKGAEPAVRMLGRLRQSGLPVRLVLTSPQEVVDWHREQQGFLERLSRLIDGLGLRPHVELVPTPKDLMPRLYARSHVVVYPSDYPEPLGLAPLEAMSAGRPVVVTAIGGLPEAVVHGRTGYVVTPGSLDQLTDRVRKLLLDPGLSRRLGQAGRRHVERQFNLETYVDKMCATYAALLDNQVEGLPRSG